MDIKFRKTEKTDYKFLYELLEERPSYVNISHMKMPTYEEHCNFCSNAPYLVDNIILYNKTRVGRIYLTKNNEIGIFIKKEHQTIGVGSCALRKFINECCPETVFANVAPTNKISQKFFEDCGFRLIQYTYRLDSV
jgi:RimJ/RimL family protein N-acetyltransferase